MSGENDAPTGRRLLHAVTSVALLAVLAGLAAAAPAAAPSPGVVAWGCEKEDYGQCLVPADLGDLVGVTAGYLHNLGLRSDGTVAAWGYNPFGNTDVPAGLTGVVAIAAGYYTSFAVKADGTVEAWGRNEVWADPDPPSGLDDVVAVAAGTYHALALKADGTVVGWGSNQFGQTTVPAGLRAIAISAGYRHSAAVRLDGTVAVWGMGQPPPAGLGGVVAVASGYYHNLALRADGTVVAWGSNGHGESDVPTDLGDVVAIAASYGHSLALKSDGNVVAWGCGDYTDAGQCTAPDGLAGVTAIGAGVWHSLALAGGPADTTPPEVSCRVEPEELWPPSHELVEVTATVGVADEGSGPAGFTLVSVESSEPDEGLGDGDTAGDIAGFELGTADTAGLLRAERSGSGEGRVYSLVYEGADLAGNTAECVVTVTVPHDRKKGK